MPLPSRPLARLLTRTLHPAPNFIMSPVQPFLGKLASGEVEGGVMITLNHYSAPDFQSWWYVIPISAVFPVDIHWIVAGAWRNSGWGTALTQWLFPRGARLLGYTSMPPMPPDPAETEQRAAAVRDVLAYCKSVPHPVIGITPEGADHPGGVLGELPPGVGRFMHMISQSCPHILPVGVWKESGRIYLNFGSPYKLDVTQGLPTHERDARVAQIIMCHVAALLPDRLRGKYSDLLPGSP
jgi:hypothetical protein